MSSKLVSIVIPVRNRASLMRHCLEKIQLQTHPYIETIVVDGNSTDETVDVCESFAKQVDLRVLTFPTEGDHRCAQRNMGVREARGEYVLILDSDMELSPHVVADCVKQMGSAKDVTGVIIPEESFGEGFWAQCKKLEKSFYVGVDWMEAARFYDKKMFLSIGGYDESMTSGEDWDLSQRMGKKGSIVRTDAYIFHNEGKISLVKTVKNKYYYASKMAHYTQKSDSDNVTQQVSLIDRYKLFFSQPKKLFADLEVGIGMLVMKTLEFGFGGLGIVISKMKK